MIGSSWNARARAAVIESMSVAAPTRTSAMGSVCPSSLIPMGQTAIAELGRRAKAASRVLASASTNTKDAALHAAADLLVDRVEDVLAANRRDVERAERG